MNNILRRGAVLLTALALALSAAPCALAQSPADEEEAPAQGPGDAEEAPAQGPADAEKAPAPAVPRAAPLQTVGGYAEGLIRVSDGTLWGYAAADGSVTIQPQFESAENFSLGAARVIRDGKPGLLRWDGSFLLEPVYDELTAVGCGVYLGRRGEVWDLLSVAAVEGSSHQIEAGLASAFLVGGTLTRQLVLCGQDGTVRRVPVNSLPQFLKERKVPGWQFPLSTGRQASYRDVSERAWYARWVNLASGTGLMQGVGGGLFEPARALTVAEALRLAACLESRARQDDFHLQSISGSVWYKSSVTYCEASGIIAQGEFGQEDFNRPITRAEMAGLFAATTPVRSMENRNDPDRVKAAVPDVNGETFAAGSIYLLYAKGILNGSDGLLSFRPEDSLTRAEAAAVAARIARPEQRIDLW